MENKNRSPKTFTNLLSKILGLVFFSCLAISLGVVFGLLFDGWVKYQPGTPVGTENSTLQTVDLSDQGDDQSATATDPNSGNTANTTVDNASQSSVENETATNTKPVTDVKTAVKFKVRVGPYADRNQAVAASGQLKTLGYPVYVGPNPPFAVQVGAFSTQSNAEKLKTELTGKGYKAFIDKNP